MPVALSDYVKQNIRRNIVEKILNHIDTPAWNSEIASKVIMGTFDNKTKNYIRETIIGRGQADFTVGFNGLTVEDKALLYSYFYFQMHYSSSYAVFCTYKTWIENGIWKKCKGVAFIDMGCGPFTSGLAFLEISNDYFKAYKPFNYHYIGIDIAQSMLDITNILETDYRTNATPNRICYNSIVCKTDYKQITEAEMNEDIGIIINCCYFFASPTMDVTAFTEAIQLFVEKHKKNQICFIYQNALSSRNYIIGNYQQFLKNVNVLKQANHEKNLTFSFLDEFDSTNYAEPTFVVTHQVLIKNIAT